MKPILLISVFLLTSISLCSQIKNPVRYNLDSLHIHTDNKDYKYIRVVQTYTKDPSLFVFNEYTRDGVLIMKAVSSMQDKQRLQGPRIDYYENGNIKQESNYTDNQLTGQQIDWHENGNKKAEKEYIIEDEKKHSFKIKINNFWDANGIQKVTDGNGGYEESEKSYGPGKIAYYGQGNIKNGEKDGIWHGWIENPNIKFTEEYKEGKFISGKTVDQNNEETTYNVLEIKPEPKGGMTNFYKYIAKNLILPDALITTEGELYIHFVIDKEGKITEPKVIRDLGYGTGDQAIQLLNKYPDKFIHGEQKGRKVRVPFLLPITIFPVK